MAIRSEQIGYSLSLIAELNLNDIKGISAPSLDAWSTAAALTAVTTKLEYMVAVRPTFHNPALLAKTAANLDRIGGGNRLSLNVVSSWWRGEAERYGVEFEEHGDRYARTEEWLTVLNELWRQDGFDFDGRYYRIRNSTLQPKPITTPRPTIYAGGESEAAKELIARTCDAYVMHGDPPARIAEKIADMRARRERMHLPPMQFGVAAYAIVRGTEAEAQTELARITDVKQSNAGFANYQEWLAGTKLEARVSLQDYSVSNRGLRAGTSRHAGSGARPRGRVRAGGGEPAAAADESAVRGDGAVRGGGDRESLWWVVVVIARARTESTVAPVLFWLAATNYNYLLQLVTASAPLSCTRPAAC